MLPVLEFMRRSHLPAEDVLKFAKEVMNYAEVMSALKEQLQTSLANYEPDDFAILDTFTGYYAWKNDIDMFKRVTLSHGYHVVRSVIRGDLESLDSEEALEQLRAWPEID